MNYFGHVVQQLSKEIQELMTIMKNTLALPRKHQYKEKDDQDSLWKMLIDSMKNEVIKVL